MTNETPLHHACSINACPNEAVAEEEASIKHWSFTIYYRHEHFRELRAGTPLGPVGIDGCHVAVVSRGVVDPLKAGHNNAVSPQ